MRTAAVDGTPEVCPDEPILAFARPLGYWPLALAGMRPNLKHLSTRVPSQRLTAPLQPRQSPNGTTKPRQTAAKTACRHFSAPACSFVQPLTVIHTTRGTPATMPKRKAASRFPICAGITTSGLSPGNLPTPTASSSTRFSIRQQARTIYPSCATSPWMAGPTLAATEAVAVRTLMWLVANPATSRTSPQARNGSPSTPGHFG